MESEVQVSLVPAGQSVPVIRIVGVSKAYRLYDNPVDRLKESLHPFRKKYHREFFALKDISLEIQRGETIGIIGRNGSGKSTLLKIIAGVLTPTNGIVSVGGKVSALLELGMGYNPEASGIENIYSAGTIMGYSGEEIKDRIDDILSFADIGDFVYQPMKSYSTGMFMRLAFSVATSVKPEVLIVDEALSVGDMFFQAKCMDRMRKMIEDHGTTLLFVSHAVDTLKNICKKAVYLEHGQIRCVGNSEYVTDQYLKDLRSEMYTVEPVDYTVDILQEHSNQAHPETGGELKESEVIFKNDMEFQRRTESSRYGSGGARVRCVELLNECGEPSISFGFYEKIIVRAHIECRKDLDALNCCVLVRNKDGIDLMHTTTREAGHIFPKLNRGNRLIVDFSFNNILKGNYLHSIHFSVNNTFSLEEQEILDAIESACVFESRFDPAHPVWHSIWYPFGFDYHLA